MGKHSIYAVDWDLMLQTKDVVPDDVTHVGIRGHWMKVKVSQMPLLKAVPMVLP